MKQESFTTVILLPGEGKYLTQMGEVDVIDRIVATRVAVGENDSAETWMEISAEAALAFKREREEALKAFHEERARTFALREERSGSAYIEGRPEDEAALGKGDESGSGSEVKGESETED